MIVTIDTNILVKGFINKDLDALTMLLHNFGKSRPEMSIVIDYGDVIRGEYQDNVGSEELFQKWFHYLQSQGNVEYRDGNLSNKIANALTKLGFHEEEDQTFVSVALNSDLRIVTEDSDYGKGGHQNAINNQHVLSYMQNVLGLTIWDVGEAATNL